MVPGTRSPIAKTAIVILCMLMTLPFSGCSSIAIDDNVTGPGHQTVVSGKNLTITFLDVGQGNAILIEAPDRAILVDGGERDYGDEVVGFLKGRGIHRLDAVIATHPHSDHIGGLITVLEVMDVGIVYDSGQMATTPVYFDFLQVISDRGIPYDEAVPGSLDLSSAVKINVLGPSTPMFDGDTAVNDNSIILKVTYGEFSVLLTGDAGFRAEDRIMNKDPGANLLQVAHHGSRYSTGDMFLDRVSPDIAVISVGRDNGYGHPSQDTMGRLQSHGIDIYRTDLDGTVSVTSDGTSWAVTSYGTRPSATIMPSSDYVGNSYSMKFHRHDCASVPDIKPGNIVYLDSRDDAISKGYQPCKICDP